MNKNLQIAIPTMGTLRAELVAWLLNQANPVFMTIEVSPFSKAMNHAISVFLDKSEAQYLMLVDDDTIPPDDAVEKLMELMVNGADVATAITPIKRGRSVCANVFEEYEDVNKCAKYTNETAPFEVKGCGSACMIVSREILEKMKKPYFKHVEFDDGNLCTGELYFCDNVLKHGGKIMCDPTVRCAHFKPVGLELE